MTCYNTVADIDKLETWFPGYALWAYDASHVRVKDMFINIDNPAYLYSQEPAVGTDYSSRANVFADKCNITTSIRDSDATTKAKKDISASAVPTASPIHGVFIAPAAVPRL